MGQQRFVLSHLENIYHLELNAPPSNTTDSRFFEELSEIIKHLTDLCGIQGLIISSRGRHFSSGANIPELMAMMGEVKDSGLSLAENYSLSIFNKLKKFQFPVVAAIQGCCLGSGLELALSCHYRIAEKNALFGLPETGYGLIPGCGGTVYLPQLIGLGKSIEIILGGHRLLAEDAYKLGVIDFIEEKKELVTMARRLIHKQSHNSL